jgi:hypothetical protein
LGRVVTGKITFTAVVAGGLQVDALVSEFGVWAEMCAARIGTGKRFLGIWIILASFDTGAITAYFVCCAGVVALVAVIAVCFMVYTDLSA